MRKILKSILFLILLAIPVLAVIGYTPDLDPAELRAKYANGESEFVTLPGGANVHYRDQGNPDGPVLLLVHGSNSSLHTWEPLVALLGDRYRLITLDLPGHGLTGATPADDYSLDTMASTVMELADHIELPAFFLAGNSMGGGTGAVFATRHGDRLKGLVLVDAAGLPRDILEEDIPLGFKLARTPGLNKVLEIFTPRELVKEGIHKSFGDQTPVTTEMIDRYYELLLYPGNRRATGIRFVGYVQNPEYVDPAQISTPTLIIWGDQDRLIPVSQATIWHEGLPNSRLEIFEGVGHIPMEEVPRQTADTINQFIQLVLSQE